MLVAKRYRTLELLGRGAMGEVWRAEDTALGREVAVKLLLEQVAMDNAAERFRHEAQTAARLNHPNVVAVYDFDEEDGRAYLVMELVPGRSLRHELAARGALDIDEVRRTGAQAAAGLAAAHAHGVVHRDVKPGNLLLTADGTVKVADFGIARAAMEAGSSMTTTGAVLGTGNYLAPERGMGRDAEPASDVYALGCVLYEMLCGRPPFTGDPAAVVYQHVDQPPQHPAELRPDVPAALAASVLGMLAKDPAARPTAGEAARFLTEDTEPARAGAGAFATAEEADASQTTRRLPVARGRRRSRRSVVLASVALAAVFLLACVVGFQLNASHDDAPPATKPSESGPRSPSPDTPSTTAPPGGKERAPGGPRDGKDRREPSETSTEQSKEARKQAEKEAEEARRAAEEERKQREEERKKAAEEQKKR
ncbi:serine/threonine-protein kinase [Streptomyces winkii]|uniref:serine/threonine-protein kinase n=1 Tax=Streptomyces winkii TaxID=3051178 RepID=UPI0028D1AD96|nr:protein kinase [Streptomyces sp. DSM 40971]